MGWKNLLKPTAANTLLALALFVLFTPSITERCIPSGPVYPVYGETTVFHVMTKFGIYDDCGGVGFAPLAILWLALAYAISCLLAAAYSKVSKKPKK